MKRKNVITGITVYADRKKIGEAPTIREAKEIAELHALVQGRHIQWRKVKR